MAENSMQSLYGSHVTATQINGLLVGMFLLPQSESLSKRVKIQNSLSVHLL